MNPASSTLSHLAHRLLPSLAATGMAMAVQAQSLYWDADGAIPGAGGAPSGTWGVDAFWNTDAAGGAGAFGAATGSATDAVVVAGPSASSGNAAFGIALSGPQSARSLTLQAAGALTLSGTGPLQLGVGGLLQPAFAYGTVANGAATLSAPVLLMANQAWTNNSANAITLSGGLDGAFDLAKAGAGTLNVNQNTSPGHANTRVLGGRISYNNAATSGTFAFGSGTIRVDGGGRFHFNPSAGSLALGNPLEVGPGGGTFSTPSSTGRTITYSGALRLGGPVILGQVDGGGGGGPGGVFAGPVEIDQSAVGTRRITLSAGGNHGPTLSGNIVDGPGTAGNALLLRVVDSSNGRDVTLSGINEYKGDTIIQGVANGSSAGRFILVAPTTPNSLGLGQGNVTLESGAHLRLGANAVLAVGKRVTPTPTANQPTTLALGRDVDPASVLNPATTGAFTLSLDTTHTTPVINLSTLTADGKAILGVATGLTIPYGGTIVAGADALYRFGAGGGGQGAGGTLQLTAVNALSGNNSLQVGGWYGNTGREGHGSLALNAANSFVGDARIAAGNALAGSALIVRHAQALGDPANVVTLETSAANGPALRLEMPSGNLPNPLVLVGTGSATLSSTTSVALDAGVVQDGASTLVIGAGAGVIALTAPASAPAGKTSVTGGSLAISNLDQIGDGNLNLGTQGVLVFNGLSWADFVLDRQAGVGGGPHQWQLSGGGFAARGTGLRVDAAGTTPTTFDANFTLGSPATEAGGAPYANAAVILDRGTSEATITLSPSVNRAWHIQGSSTTAGASTYALRGPAHAIEGRITGGAPGRKWHFTGPNANAGLGEIRLANPLNDFSAEIVLAGNTASPPDSGSGVLIVADDRALGHATNVVTMVSSSPTGGGAGWMVMLDDGAGAGNRFDRTLVNDSRGSPSAPPVGLGSLRGNPVFTGSVTVRNQAGNAAANSAQAFNFQTQAGSTLTLGAPDNAAELAGNRNGSATQVWRKTGPGTLVLNQVSITNATGSHVYQIYEGALREAGNGALNSLNNARLIFTHLGVLESRGVFNRPLGSTNPGEVSWSSSAGGGGLGGGGFAAQGGALTVDLNATDANLEWGDTNCVRNGAPLVFGSETANDRVTWVDNFGLASADNTTATREILVVDNPGSGADLVEISGRLHNRGGGGAGGTGTRSLLKSGAGTLVLSGANTYNGTTTVSAGTLVCNGSLSATANPVLVQAAGTLEGTGVLVRPAVIEGVLAPAGTAQGTLTVATLAIASNGTLRVGLGAVAGEDRVVVQGDVSLAPGAELLPTAAGGAATNSVHVIVDNQGANPVSGTFSRLGNPLSENEVFSASGMSLRISYAGGDGNDVTLTVLTSTPSSGYDGWIAGFGTLSPTARDPEDDPDQDGQNNLLEYFAALDPTVVNPPMMNALDATGATLRFTFRRGTDIPDLAYAFEWSTNFTDWFPPDAQHVFAETVTGSGAGFELVRGTLSVPAGMTRVYARVKITRIP